MPSDQHASTSLVGGANGVPLHFVSVLSDISERKCAEAEANRFRAAMDATIDFIFLTDPATMRFLYVNETACRRVGYTQEQLLQKPPFELFGKIREELTRENEEVIAAGERGTRSESRYVRSDGSAGWTELYRRALIDRSFIVVMMKDSAAMTLVQTMISLAHSLGIKVIAEGVEEEQQAECLRLLRCDQIHGYLISKPVPFEDMTRLLQTSQIGKNANREPGAN